jgi:exodeoxyribonuclease VII large subunit
MYLNEWVIAQQVAQLPLAVLTGIGHERDNTILDEIAHTPCDTPSKVIAFIREQIVQQARNGAGYWHWIKQQALLIVAQVKAQQRKVVTQIRHQAQQGLNQEKQRLQVTFHHCDKQIHAHLQQQQHQLIRLKQQTLWSAQQTLFLQKQQIRPYPQRLRQQITRQLTQQYQQLSHYHHLIQSNDPKRLLNAGYVLVRSANGQVLTQLTQAQQHPCFWLHFQDGDLLVAEVKE